LVENCNYSCKSSSGSVAPLEITATKPTAAAEKKLADTRERDRERQRQRQREGGDAAGASCLATGTGTGTPVALAAWCIL